MRQTFDPNQDNGMPVWSPDGRRIAFQSKRNGKWGLYQKNSDGTGAESLLIESELVKVPMARARRQNCSNRAPMEGYHRAIKAITSRTPFRQTGNDF